MRDFLDAVGVREIPFIRALADFQAAREELRAPRADLDGKHAVYAGIEPKRKKFVDLAVAIHPDHIAAMPAEQCSEAFDARDEDAFEMFRREQRAVVETHVFPQSARVIPRTISE